MKTAFITGSGEDGIQIIDYSGQSNREFIIERNLISNSTDVGLGLMDNGETNEDFRAASMPERIYVYNNTFDSNTYGITGGDNLIALNNLFINSFALGIKDVDGGSIAAYNLFWNNGFDEQGSNLDPGTTVFADPLLDANSRLSPGSPAIDAGTAFFEWQGQIVLDLPDSAYFGSAPDLGAFENGADVKFAVLGDYGDGSIEARQVSQMIIDEGVDFVVTTADNRYGSITMDEAIGNFYNTFISMGKFFPSLGNHDYGDGGGVNEYLNNFEFPNNERY